MLARAGSGADIEETSSGRTLCKRPEKANCPASFRQLRSHRKVEGNVGACGNDGIDKLGSPSLEAKLNASGRLK